jgi:hypothetical protein
MRLIKVTTSHTNEDIDDILYTLSESEIKNIKNIYGKIKFVEYVDNLFSCMFCILDNYDIIDLENLYRNLSIDFKIEDITKNVLLSEDIKTLYLNENGFDMSKEINKLIKEFYKQNVTTDDILDKINLKGITSITKLDKLILKEF